MSRVSARLLRVLVVLVSAASALPVFAALPQRTFVASNGNDANPCSLILPCRGFTAAVAAVVVGGEVVALDSAGYGPVTITKSVSIIAPPGVYAGISVSAGGNAAGVWIATADVKVALRGLTINGVGGSWGVFMIDGAELFVENCVISNLQYGVWIQARALVSIAGSTIRDAQWGVSAGSGATVNVANSQVLGNLGLGIGISGGSGGVTTRVHVADTLITGRGSAFCLNNRASTETTGHISATRVTVTNCAWAVYNWPFEGGTLTISNSLISGNGVGFASEGSDFFTLGNNQLSNNGTDTGGTIITVDGK